MVEGSQRKVTECKNDVTMKSEPQRGSAGSMVRQYDLVSQPSIAATDLEEKVRLTLQYRERQRPDADTQRRVTLFLGAHAICVECQHPVAALAVLY